MTLWRKYAAEGFILDVSELDGLLTAILCRR